MAVGGGGLAGATTALGTSTFQCADSALGLRPHEELFEHAFGRSLTAALLPFLLLGLAAALVESWRRPR